MKTTSVTIRMSEEDKARLQQRAASEHRTVGEVVRMALEATQGGGDEQRDKP